MFCPLLSSLKHHVRIGVVLNQAFKIQGDVFLR